jgi:hypothetical protein
MTLMEAKHHEKHISTPNNGCGVESVSSQTHEKRAADNRSITSNISAAGSEHSTVADGEDICDPEHGLERVLTQKKPIVKVPRSQRRGLFARFAIVAEVTEPYDYPDRTKWFIVFVIGLAAAAAPVGSAIILRQPPPVMPGSTPLTIHSNP